MKVVLMIIAIIVTVVSVINAANSKEDPVERNFFGPTGFQRSPFNMFQPPQPAWGLSRFQRFGMTGSRMMHGYHRYGVPGTVAGGMPLGNPLTSRGALWNNFLNQPPTWGGRQPVNPYDVASANTGYMW